MSETKSYSTVNGWMLFLVFSSCTLVARVPALYDRWQATLPERPSFARLIRREDKSYFGYHRHYFTLLYETPDEEVRFVAAVDSDLFHLKKVGDNIEVMVRSPHNLRIARTASSRHHSATSMISGLLALAGGILLITTIRNRNST